MFTITKKALLLTSKITNRSLNGTIQLMDRLSDPNDTLLKKGIVIGQISSGVLILTGAGVTLVSFKAGVGLLLAGAVSLTSNTLFKYRKN